jgi:general secretion pathway protein I
MLTQAPHSAEPAERDDSGFAILEALVALAIVALALAVLLAVFTDGIRRQGRAERLASAVLDAQSLLARIGADVPLKAGVTGGTLPNGLHWQLRVEPYGDRADRKAWPATAYRVLVEVMAEDDDPNGPLVRLATLRLGPKEPQR